MSRASADLDILRMSPVRILQENGAAWHQRQDNEAPSMTWRNANDVNHNTIRLTGLIWTKCQVRQACLMGFSALAAHQFFFDDL